MLRNRELLRFAALLAALSAAFAAAGFSLSPEAGALALACCAALCAAFFAFTFWRYGRIARLCERVDEALHRADAFFTSCAREGELSILEDELQKMTLRIRRQNDALRREKARLSDSLEDVAHQLRTPLTSAALALSLAAEQTDAGARAEALVRVREPLARMDALITALLKLSRLNAGLAEMNAEPVRVRGLAEDALRALAIPLELRGTDVRLAVPEDATLSCDALWMGEALANLIKNAMESAGEGGLVEIAWEENPLYGALSVRDSGPGFARAELARLFDRHYRGARSAGYGIGLALARAVVERHGGTLSASNAPQGGALLTARFPHRA